MSLSFLFACAYLYLMRGCLCRWIWAGCEKVAKRRWAQKRAKGISFEKTATLWLCYYLQEERDAALLPQQINLPLIFIIYQRGELLQSFPEPERWINSFYERRSYSEPSFFLWLLYIRTIPFPLSAHCCERRRRLKFISAAAVVGVNGNAATWDLYHYIVSCYI